jgi:hypothetical protein
MTPGIPPGVHIHAQCARPGEPPRQLRILGDDRRGYLIAGLFAIAPEEEIWSSTLDEALARAERAGVPPDAWREIADLGEVETT